MLSSFELYFRWVPLPFPRLSPFNLAILLLGNIKVACERQTFLLAHRL